MSDAASNKANIKADVSTPNKAWYMMESEWRMIRCLLGGTKAMRLAREEYLPRFEGEDDKGYEARLKRTYLYNHFKKAIQALVGKPFSKPVAHPEDITPELEEIANDFDMQGNDITMYLKKWFECGLSYGLSYTLVDFPNTAGANYTLADQKANKIRPYAVHVPAHDVIGWRAIDVNGVYKLQQLRIKFTQSSPDGDFGDVDKMVIRVYDWDPVTNTVMWRVFEETENGWIATQDGTLVGMTEIPIVCMYTGQTGFMVAEPPLLDLAYLNVAHWQMTSDHRHIMHIQAVPILFARGWSKDQLPSTSQVGPNRMMVSQNPEAQLSYIEHSGVAIGKLESSIEKLEEQMAAMAIKLLAERRPGGVTATEVAVDADAAESALKSMVAALQDATEMIVYFMMMWMGQIPKDDEIPEFRINDDFGLMLGNDMIANFLLKANAQGIIQKRSVIEGAKTIGYLPPDMNAEEEIEAAGEEASAALENMTAVLGGEDGDAPPGQSGQQPRNEGGRNAQVPQNQN